MVLFSIAYLVGAESPWSNALQKKIREGSVWKTKEWITFGLWWGALAALHISLLLLITHKFWLPYPTANQSPTRSHRFHTILITVFSLSILGYYLPMLGLSFWNDEEFAFRRFVHGEWKLDTNEFRPASWRETFFANQSGNNHHLFSVLSRVSHATLRGDRQISEGAARLPSLLAAFLTLFLLGRSLASRQSFVLALSSIAILGLHPWFLRYAMEARGYACMLLGIALCGWGLSRALETGRLRHWLAFALGEALFLLSFIGSLYVAIGINLLVLAGLIARKDWRTLRTLLAMNALAAIPVAWWLAPSLPQLIVFLKSNDVLKLTIDRFWLQDLFSHASAGVLLNQEAGGGRLGLSWRAMATTVPYWNAFFVITLPIGILTGLWVARGTRSMPSILCWGVLLGAMVGLLHNVIAGQAVFTWYFLYLLLPFSIAIPLGFQQLGKGLLLILSRSHHASPVLSNGLLLLITMFFVVATHPIREIQRKHDRQPLRQVAELMAEHPGAQTITIGVSARQILSYAPKSAQAKTAAEFTQLLNHAATQTRAVVVALAGRSLLEKTQPDVIRILDQRPDKELLATLPGHEAMFSYEVWRLTNNASQ